jgi:dihydroflavonol-4-reductase
VVDVRDVAEAHVKAMTDPGAGGHRYAMGDKTLSFLEFADVVREGMPEFAGKVPRRTVPDWMVRLFAFADKDIRGNVGELGVIRYIDSTEVVQLLGHPLVPARDAVLETARSLVEQGVVQRPQIATKRG